MKKKIHSNFWIRKIPKFKSWNLIFENFGSKIWKKFKQIFRSENFKFWILKFKIWSFLIENMKNFIRNFVSENAKIQISENLKLWAPKYEKIFIKNFRSGNFNFKFSKFRNLKFKIFESNIWTNFIQILRSKNFKFKSWNLKFEIWDRKYGKNLNEFADAKIRINFS